MLHQRDRRTKKKKKQRSTYRADTVLLSEQLKFKIKRLRDGHRIEDTHSDSRDCGIDGGPLADLHLVHRLLEHWASGVGPGNDVHLDDCLRELATLVGGLHGDAVLLAGVQFPHGLDNSGLRIYLELVQAVVRHVIDTVRYLGVLTLVVVRGLHLREIRN